MEVKDFNIFNLSLQQKKLLKKKVGSGNKDGGENNSKDIPLFSFYDEPTDGLEIPLTDEEYDIIATTIKNAIKNNNVHNLVIYNKKRYSTYICNVCNICYSHYDTNDRSAINDFTKLEPDDNGFSIIAAACSRDGNFVSFNMYKNEKKIIIFKII